MAKKTPPAPVPTPQAAPVRFKVIILECANCKGMLETDMPLERALLHRCGRCDATDWKQKNVGKAIDNDASAPLELRKEKKGEGDNE